MPQTIQANLKIQHLAETKLTEYLVNLESEWRSNKNSELEQCYNSVAEAVKDCSVYVVLLALDLVKAMIINTKLGPINANAERGNT